MNYDSLYTNPQEIESRSFAIIGDELAAIPISIPPEHEAVVNRVIHTSADFDYAKNLHFSPGAVAAGLEALAHGFPIVTDTQMALAGINKKICRDHGCETACFINDPEVAAVAIKAGTTRAKAAVDKAAKRWPDAVYVVGNAPTALLRIRELVDEGVLSPKLVVGVPVGFVNVVESKELFLDDSIPCIVAKGRKGGSNVAAANINALLYQLPKRDGVD